MININSRKRSGLSILYVMFFLALALMILPGTHADTYNTSKPIIEVNYGEIPVTILDYNLSDIYGTNWTVFPITAPLYGLRGYNFTVSFLDNGDYVFYVLANDTDGNTVEGYKEFTIAHPEMAVWLIEPITGIGRTPTYNITVGTQRIATCRWSTTNWPFNNKEKFDLELGEPFTVTGNRTTHILTYTASTYPIPLYVFCRNDIYGVNLSDLANYGSTHFMVGYDTEPPEITELVADPNPVIDQNDKRTTIRVVTDEPTVCHITGGNETHIGHTNWGWEDNYFAGEDPSDYTSYTLMHEENISYNSVPIGEPYNTRYNITCFDRAQWNDWAYQNVLVNINTSLNITQVTPASVGDLTIDYEIRTNVNANGCMMKLNGEPDWQNMTANTARNFTRPITLLLGENDIEVFCYASTIAFANFTVTADNEPPELQIDAFDSTCGLEEINVFVNATDQGTGIDTVWYRVTDSSEQVIVGWTEMEDPTDTTLTIENLELENGEQYTVTAYAIDNANLYSGNETDTLTATGPDEPECDTIAPIANISYVGDTYQKNVTIQCADDVGGTGCSESFEYAGITEGSCADVESYESMTYTELPLILTSDTFLCVRVSDNALPPNYGYANMSIPVQTVICGNNVAEPGVLGSDPEQCDGTDLREFTCNNFPGFNGGILACTPPDGTSDECKWDTSNCQLGNHGYCGDNVTNDYYYEQCDGTFEDGDWGNIEGCTDFNFTGGSLSCNPYTMPEGQRCMFNTSGCYKTPSNPTPRCDGFAGSFLTLLDSNEQCEPFLFETIGIPALSCSDFDRFGQGELGCTDACLIDISDCSAPPPDPFCGDGEIQPEGNETCDPPGSEILCSDLDDGAYTGGTAVCGENCRWSEFPCTPVPYCGDNERTGDEQCDGTDLGNMGCTDIGSYVNGTLSCFPQGHPNQCEFDETNCDRGSGYCGDGLINNPFVEQCDGESWGGISKQANIGCQQFGFSGGTLECYEPGQENQCMFDTHLCTDVSSNDICGDRILQSGEQCETDKLFTLLCTDFDSYTGGDLECDYSTCLFDTTGCNNDPLCGNGQVDNGETCDGNDFGDLNDCSDLRPTLTGPLECFPPGHQQECQINQDACEYLGGEEYCGDGIVNDFPNEVCDSTDLNGLSCIDLGFVGGTLSCYAEGTPDECKFNIDECTPAVQFGSCGDGVLNDNETCDPGIEPLPLVCTDIDSFEGGTIGCYATGPDECTYNIEGCTPPAPGYCGDGIANGFEECDLGDLRGMVCTRIDAYIGGDLGCYPSDYPIEELRCTYDKSQCDRGFGYCGDNRTNNFPNEQCDGIRGFGEWDWGNIEDCTDLGFFSGTLECNECWFDTSGCVDQAFPDVCNNGILNTGEQCESSIPLDVTCSDFDSFNAGDLECSSDCNIMIDDCYIAPAQCGNGQIDSGETCDYPDLGGSELCAVRDPSKYTGGTVSCNLPGTPGQCSVNYDDCVYDPSLEPYCGDGIANGVEDCDGDDFGLMTCSDIGSFQGGILACNADCTFNTDNCNAGPGYCGDNIINNFPNEQCDGDSWGNVNSCIDFGFTGGTLSCNPPDSPNRCIFNTTMCTGNAGFGSCGNQVLNRAEQCEVNRPLTLGCTDFDAFVGGDIECDYSLCRYDISGCEISQGSGYCGDDMINDFPNEECDGTDWGNINSCDDIDPAFTSGTISCWAPGTGNQCIFNTNNCVSENGEGECGDGEINNGESCEAGVPFGATCTDFDQFIGGLIGCDYSTCQYDLSECQTAVDLYCGDGIITPGIGEECDGEVIGSVTECSEFDNRFVSGQLGCTADCQYDLSDCEEAGEPYCGDGIANSEEEQCDGSDLRSLNCNYIDTFDGGILGCNSDCTYDISNCNAGPGYCGDNIINNFPFEQCDGDSWGNIHSCAAFGFTGGTLTCNPPGSPQRCTFNTSLCSTPAGFSTCGNQILNRAEQCELNRPFTLACVDFDAFTGGDIACDYGSCIYDISGCIRSQGAGYCGDGIINQFPNEECDANDWGNINSCDDIDPAFIGGTISCNPPNSAEECIFNTDNCISENGDGYCGDGEINNGESCEEGVTITAQCTDFDQFIGGFMACDYSTCQFNLINCETEYELYCGDGVITTGLGEECDGEVIGPITECSQIPGSGYVSGEIGCTADCKLDLSDCQESEEPYCGDGIANGLEKCDGNDIGLMSCNLIDSFQGGILACNADCTFNTDNCDAGPGYCGDNIINNFPNEQCDGISWGDIDSCVDFGFTDGQLSCNPPGSPNRCTFNTSLCSTPAGSGTCGDQMLNRHEQCDINRPLTLECIDFDSFGGGEIACDYSSCMYDISGCEQSQGSGYCGDGMINQFPNEDCDGDDWGNINSCDDIDPAFTGGSLSCSNDCSFNTDNCVSENGEGICGDDEINNGEECEAGVPLGASCTDFDEFVGGDMGCDYATCQYDLINCLTETILYCGDGIITPGIGEECDGEVLGAISMCSEFDDRFVSGQLGCTADCKYDLNDCEEGIGYHCGDGIANGFEDCDGNDFGLMTCNDIGSFQGGILACNADCSFNTDNCDAGPGYCGDNIINNFPNEQCDGENWGHITGCADFGFTGGTLSCYPASSLNRCIFNTSQCTGNSGFGTCGNQILNRGEQCDINRPLTLGCSDFDEFTGGDIGCNYGSCIYDISGCEQSQGGGYCGDGAINDFPNEDCDGNDWGNINSCDDIDPAFTGGSLSCSNDCSFNTDNCVSENGEGICGDEEINNGEECEAGVPLGALCTEFDQFIGGAMGCDYDACQYDLSECQTAVELYCGDGVITPGLGEECDGEVIGSVTECSEFDNRFVSGQLGCTADCQYDLSDCGLPEVLYCGDGEATGFGEECDRYDLNGASCADIGSFVGGTLSCFPPNSGAFECTYNTINCNLGHGYCGDGLINNMNQEQCDGNNWGRIDSCLDLGFTGGILSCNAPFTSNQCTFNTELCTGISGGYCGNQILNPGEQCEYNRPLFAECTDFDSFIGGIIGCDYDTCLYDLLDCTPPTEEFCGDGYISGNEECDGEDLGQNTLCTQFGSNFIGGTVNCHPPGSGALECQYDLSECVIDESGYCGDGTRNGEENCDGDDFGLMTCDLIGSFQGGILACNSDCTFNTDNCDAGPGYCGDNIINDFPNEQCDGDSWGDIDSCTDFGFTGGTLSCASDCQFNTDSCTTPAGTGTCGNQILNIGEQCELNRPITLGCDNLDEFTGGTLLCNYATCMFDISGCEQSQGGGYCGDGAINDFPNEDCDGNDWGNINSCDDIDPAFTGGSLSCSNDCSFNTDNCVSENGEGICGDDEINNGEECEAGVPLGASCNEFDQFTGGAMGCDYDACQYDLSECQTEVELYCGDGVITPGLGEVCDGEIIGSVTECSQYDNNFVSGQLGCTADCQYDLSDCVEDGGGEEYCGDGIMNDPFNEQCDMGTNGLQCIDFNGFTGGTLTCGSDCQFDTSQCISPYNEGYCGDGELNIYEQCEPGQQITTTCQAMGFLGGTLSCNAAGTEEGCQLNIDNCIPAIDLGYCGDGYVIPEQEWCDTFNLGGLDCTYFDDFVGGLLGCYPEGTSSPCNWDTSNCDRGTGYCGDGIINNPFNEQCDGTSWGSISSCADFGFNGGTLGCYSPEETSRCTFDTSQCTTPAGDGPCGNSILNRGEQCEQGITFDLSCTDFDGYIGGEIGCDYTTCQYVLDECELPSVAVCGDGFISGSEQCDGLNLGPTTLCEDFDDEFIGGSLSCYPAGNRRACRFDLSSCESETPVTDCGNNNVEDGEECDGTENFFSCEDFGLESGSIGCYDDCTVDTSSCVGETVIEQVCGNDRSEPSEECDGGVEELFAQSFIDLYGCQYGLGCSDACTIECLAEVTYTCDNLIKDGDETGFNCGGSCPACDDGESCVDNTDCKSGRCVNGECALDQCMNGLLDGDETGTDCGGSCPACPEGEYCFSDNDCQSGRCIDGICMPPEPGEEEKKPNTAGIILIILGLVMMLGGGGYVVYEEYFDKKRIAAKHPPVMPMQQQRPQQPQMTIDPKLLEMQKKKQEERRQQQQDARKSLLEGFDKESAPKSEDDIEQLKERKVNKDVLKEAGYIDLTEQKTEEKESGDIFDKLKRIGDKQKSEERKAEGGFETYDDEGTAEATKSEEPAASLNKGRKSRLVKVKRKSDTFEKLGNIGQGVNKSDIRSTSGKISELSGKNKSSITKILNSESISQKQVNNMFSNLDKEKLTSDVFREILSDLVNKGKLSKETVSAMLFEYMDNGTLDKSDVAKIMSELKMV